jgi:hypothetical protein
MVSPPKITRQQWEEKQEEARKFMESRKHVKKLLIEIGAQHPLMEGMYPNNEFAQRLLLGIDLYHKSKHKGFEVEFVVGGSRHMYKGIIDKISLSQAGVNFLIAQGIPNENIHGLDLIQKYKKTNGVYTAADECFVATNYFKDGEFGQLYSVVSPVQALRKMLHYIWFGVYPLMYSTPVFNSYHNYIKEVFDFIPYVRDIDPDMQDENSTAAVSSRKVKQPKD